MDNTRDQIHEPTFAEQIENTLSEKNNSYNNIKVCDTPQIFVDVGCDRLPMLYTQQHLRDALKPKGANPHHHGLTKAQIKSIPTLLTEPAMLFDSLSPHKNGNKSIIAVLNATDNDKAPIVVSVVPNGRGMYMLQNIETNFITSIYGKETGFYNLIKKAAEIGNILYWNKQRSQELFKFQGLQLPEALNNLDFNIIIHQSRNIVNSKMSKKLQEENKMAENNNNFTPEQIAELMKSSELIKQLVEQVGSLQKQLDAVSKKQDIFNEHLNQIYNSKSIEETLGIMSDMGKSELDAAECEVYSYDAIEDKLFTVSENGERVYTEIEDQTAIGAALLNKETFVDNNYSGSRRIGGNENDDPPVKNVAVIPLEAKSGDIIGVVVCKNKVTGFTEDDIKKFDLKSGEIGSAFRMGMENKSLKQAAITDKLTHLPNRQGAQDYLKSTVLPQLKNEKDTAVIMCDIDHFKNVNDTYGHDAGDKVLQHVAKVISENMREGDSVFRWGGEEMVVIMNNANTSEAYGLAERLREKIASSPCNIGNGQTINVTMSMGVEKIKLDNVHDINQSNIFEFFENNPLKAADTRLYEAKETGRNKVVADSKELQTEIAQTYSPKSEKNNDSIKDFNEDLIKTARSADLANYFLTHGYDCKMETKNELHVKGFGGLRINTEKNSWYQFSQNRGSSNPVNCLTEVLGMDFKTAVKELTNKDFMISKKAPVSNQHIPAHSSEAPATVIYSIAQNDEIRHYKTDKDNIDNVLNALKSEKPFVELSNLGERISEAEFAEIEQTEKAISLDFVLDPREQTINLFMKRQEDNINQRIPFDRNSVQSAIDKIKSAVIGLPERNNTFRNIYAYFCNTRRIDKSVVDEMIKRGTLYQDKKGNAVFVRRDETGNIVGAEVHGTNTFKRYKGIVGDGDNVVSFKIGEPNKVYVFESAIDMMSFKELANQDKIQNSLLVSMGGLKATALEEFQKAGMKIYSCVDNDEAGHKFTSEHNFSSCHKALEETGTKDWNELLKKKKGVIELSEEKSFQSGKEKSVMELAEDAKKITDKVSNADDKNNPPKRFKR